MLNLEKLNAVLNSFKSEASMQLFSYSLQNFLGEPHCQEVPNTDSWIFSLPIKRNRSKGVWDINL